MISFPNQIIRRQKHRSFDPEAGFTLVEVLVAFTILAMITVTIQRAVTVAVNGIARAERRIDAEMVARTLLTGPLGAGPNATNPKRGQMDGMEWTLNYAPLNLPFVTPAGMGSRAWLPFKVFVTVRRRNATRPDLAVETVRLIRVSSP